MNRELTKVILEGIKGIYESEIALNMALGTGTKGDAITLFTDSTDEILAELFVQYDVPDDEEIVGQYMVFFGLFITDNLDVEDFINLLEGNLEISKELIGCEIDGVTYSCETCKMQKDCELKTQEKSEEKDCSCCKCCNMHK